VLGRGASSGQWVCRGLCHGITKAALPCLASCCSDQAYNHCCGSTSSLCLQIKAQVFQQQRRASALAAQIESMQDLVADAQQGVATAQAAVSASRTASAECCFQCRLQAPGAQQPADGEPKQNVPVVLGCAALPAAERSVSLLLLLECSATG